MNRTISASLLAFSTALGACSQIAPYRDAAENISPAAGAGAGAARECVVASAGSTCAGKTALEKRAYRTRDDKTGDYLLGFVEFDDQGWFQDRRQMEVILNDIDQQSGNGDGKGKGKQHFLIFVFAHGWKHNASPADNNVQCFQRLLERLDFIETAGAARDRRVPRKVLGIYAGWRGQSMKVLENMTFWDRKNTALRVGQGGVSELLDRVAALKHAINAPATRWSGPETGPQTDKNAFDSKVIAIGHSFGGLVMYNALARQTQERAVGIEEDNARHRYPIAQSYVDFTLLVNPAFEGSMYEPLFTVATNRCYNERQRPVSMIVTSEADAATRVAFPVGRAIGNWFETARDEDQDNAIMRTVGHLPRYQTHDLLLARGKARHDYYDEDDACPYMKPTSAMRSDEILAIAAPVVQTPGQDALEKEVRYGPGGKMALTPAKGVTYKANYPYLVVKTTEDVIPGHNEIFGDDFLSFSIDFFVKEIMQEKVYESRRDVDEKGCFTSSNCVPSAVTPCEESCRREDGSSCSRRDAAAPMTAVR